VWLATDDDLLAEFEAARSAERAGRSFLTDPEAREAAAARLAAARSALVESGAVRVVLRYIGRSAVRALVAKFPPSEADHENARRQAGNQSARAEFDGEGLAPALIAASAVEPAGLTAEMVAELVEEGRLSEGELARLFGEAFGLHLGARVADLGA